MDHNHRLIICYDGEWTISADGVSSFAAKSSQGLTVPQNTTYIQLVDMIYDAIEVDKSRYDLLLQVQYKMSAGIIPPTVIKRDRDVMFFLEETSSSYRTPLCVSLVEKPITPSPLVTKSTQKSAVVPQINDPDVFPIFEQDDFFFESQNGTLLDQAESEPVTPATNPIVSPWVGLTCDIELEVTALFENKKKLQLSLHKYAMTNHFEFKVEKSRKDLWCVKCLDDKCKWRLRAVKVKSSELFEIRKFVREHTCSNVTRQESKMQVPAWVIGECLKSKYKEHHNGDDHMPKKIIEEIERSYGIKMTYNKAWRSREKVLMAVRGTVEDSYGKLPSYLYMLEKNNPGTITDIQTDELGYFRYMFISLGLSIRGFKTCCRPVLCVDVSCLEHKVGGQLLVAIALDANEELYPVAFGVVDSENNNSWTYFMQKLREAIGEVQNLVFVSDRHPNIVNALCAVFPEAEHGACTHSIKMNIKAKFKTDNCHAAFDLASCAYTFSTFNRHFDKIRAKDPRIAAYLEEIGFERWSRAFFSGKRYNQLTSNYAESFNSQSSNGRKNLITQLADYLIFTLQEWFHNRREKASEHKEHLSQHYEKFICEQAEKAIFYNVRPFDLFQFYVHDGEVDFLVDFRSGTCTCRVFDVSGLPCTHALAAARARKIDAYDFCSRYYSTESWVNAYAETCFPVCHEDVWDVPENIKQRACLKPPDKVKVKEGRRIRKRKSSQSESSKVLRRCNKCGGQGHNRATCLTLMPAPSTPSTAPLSSIAPSPSTA